MGKYIWPSDSLRAARWYLGLLKVAIDGVTLDEFIQLIREDDPWKVYSRRSVQARLNRLSSKGLIDRSKQGREVTYKISDKGLSSLEELNFHKIEVTSVWDKRWRIVIFDIPEVRSGSRYAIRRLLKQLGFKQLQLSVWIHPLPCLDQFNKIRVAYGIQEHIHLVETHTFNPPDYLLRHFQKLYPKLTIK